MDRHSETCLSRISALQDRIIQMVASKASEASWVEVVVSFEIDGPEGGETTHWIVFSVCKFGSEFKKHALFFSFDEEDLFLDLRRLYGEINDNWSTVDLRLLWDGRFAFDFDYGPPKCMHGDAMALRRFETYLDGYEKKHMKDLRTAE